MTRNNFTNLVAWPTHDIICHNFSDKGQNRILLLILWKQHDLCGLLKSYRTYALHLCKL